MNKSNKVHESLRCYISDENFIIEPSYMDPTVLSENLFISRSSSVIRRNVPAVATSQQETVMVIFGIVGIVKLWSTEYLIVITQREKVMNTAQVLGQVWRIRKVSLLPFRVDQSHVNYQQEISYVKKIEQIFAEDYLYVCYDKDISHSMQSLSDPDYNLQLPLWKRFDTRFFFNKKLSQKMIDITESGKDEQDLSCFILPVLCGFVESIPCDFNGKSAFYTLISRKNCARVGTRYFSRGIDSNGNVSNFVETEQILKTQNETRSYVQIRGSIPLYWKQEINVKYAPKMQLFGDSTSVFRQHLSLVAQYYSSNSDGHILMFNLVNSKGSEFNLAKEFQNQTALLKNSQFKYDHFDFHHECRNMQWHNISKLLNKYSKELKDIGFFHVNGQNVLMKQNGAVRTNCIDCLDRTNVVQSEISKLLLEQWLIDCNALTVGKHLDAFDEFLPKYRNTWADHADAISIMYSGTPALKTDFTRTGKRTKQGAMNDLFNSIARYVKNNFLDSEKQDALDIILNWDVDTWKQGKVKTSYAFYVLTAFLITSLLMVYSSILIYNDYYSALFWMSIITVNVFLIQQFGKQFVSMPKLSDPYGSYTPSQSQINIPVISKSSVETNNQQQNVLSSVKSAIFGDKQQERIKAL